MPMNEARFIELILDADPEPVPDAKGGPLCSVRLDNPVDRCRLGIHLDRAALQAQHRARRFFGGNGSDGVDSNFSERGSEHRAASQKRQVVPPIIPHFLAAEPRDSHVGFVAEV
jgi:hypothetical protein